MEVKNMVTHLNIFKLSFITYTLLIIASPYLTAQTWADICLFLFIGALIYQFLFLCHLRAVRRASRWKEIKVCEGVRTDRR